MVVPEAIGGGKSWAMRRKFVLLALKYAGLRLLLLRRTLPELRENHQIPLTAELYGFAKYKDTDKSFIFPNGSRLRLGYCDHESDVYQYQGTEYDVIGLEEATHFTEAQKDFLSTCNRSTRTDFKPRIYYTANPGGVGHAWFKRLFIDRQYQGKEKPNDYIFVQAKVYDNIVLMEANPEYVDVLENLPEDMRRMHLDGDWDFCAGQYYPEFRKEIHVVKPFEIPSWWKRYRSLDYGLDMTACYWWAAAPDGKYYCYRELAQSGLRLSEAATRIVSMTPKDEKITYTVASPDLWNRRQETGYSGQEIMSREGLYLTRAKHDRVQGWRVLREFLAPYEDEQGIQTARLQIFDTCPNLIRTLPLLMHDEHDPEDVADKPHEITHYPESCLTGDTIVNTPDGDFRICDLVGKAGEVYCYNESESKKTVSMFYDVRLTRKKASISRIEFIDGRHIDITEDHMVLTSSGWKMVKNLQKGEEIIEITL